MFSTLSHMNLYVPSRRRPLSSFDFTPSPFRKMDVVAILTYIAMMFGGAIALAPVAQQMIDGGSSEEVTAFALNAIIYVVVATVVWLACRKDLRASMPGNRSFSPVHLLWVPVAWIGGLVVAGILASIVGGVETSVNQMGIEAMSEQIPYWALFPVLVILGPLVEEYFFRHLLIGKLSRRNKALTWPLVFVSAAIFAGIHFVGSGDMQLVTLVPYLALGIVISSFYVLMRKSLFMAWMLHAFQNFMALNLMYLLGDLL